MPAINLADSRNRNSRVALEPRRTRPRTRYLGPEAAEVTSVRVIKGSPTTDLKQLTKDTDLAGLSQRLIDGDPEVDLELFGKRIGEATRIYLDADDEPAHGVTLKELVFDREGALKETRELQPREANVNTDHPLRWSGRLVPKAEFAHKLVFAACYRISHVDGLTYDFLYNMARELEEKQSFLLLGVGAKMSQPLVLTRNGTPYRAFLEGRTRDGEYLLLLHLSNLELKPIREADP